MPRIKPLTGNAGDFSGIVLKAAASGNIPAVHHYLSIQPDWLNQEGPHGRTLLWEAVNKKRYEMVEELVRLGADVNAMGSYYTPMLVDLSALAVAQRNGDERMMTLLEQNGATDNLYSACYRGDLDAVKRFMADDSAVVNRPSRPEPFHPRMGWNPIHYAVAGQQAPIVKYLFALGATVGQHQDLLVDWADGHSEIIKMIRKQCRKEPATKSSPAESGLENQSVPAIDRPDWMGFPELVDACRGNHNAPDDPCRVRKLLDRGANINVTDHKGKTPLHRAGQAGFVKIIALLLERGADTEIADAKGGTPIFDAAFYGRVEALGLMLDHGANFRQTDNREETALFAAARGKRLETFQLLLDRGANPEHKNNKGKTVSQIIERARNRSAVQDEMLTYLES